MQDPAKKILEDALELDEKQRARLAYELIGSLDGEQEEGAEEAWDAEIARRVADIREGRVELIPWEDFEAETEELLASFEQGSSPMPSTLQPREAAERPT